MYLLKLVGLINFCSRLFLFLVFTFATVYFIFTPLPRNATSVDPTVYAANAGYPFYEYPNEITDPASIDKSKLTRLENNDYGLNIAISAVSVMGRIFDKDFEIGHSTVSGLVLTILLVSGLLVVFSPLPLVINFLSLLALFLVSFEVAPSFLKSDLGNVRWLASIGPVLVLNLIFIFLTRINSEKKFFHPVFIMYALWLSVFGIIRQDASVFVYLFISFIFIFSFFTYFSKIDKKQLKNSAILIALLVVTPIVFNFIVKLTLTVAYERPLTKIVGMPRHGSGVPLYLGLGTSSNPFNIAWQDEIAELHAPFYYSGTEHKSLQPILASAFKKLVLLEPIEFAKGLFQKAVFLNNLFLRSQIFDKDRAYFMAGFNINRHFHYYYILFLGFSGFLLFYLFFSKNSQAKILLLSSYLIALGGFISPILVYPGYPVTAIGSVVAICSLLLPLFFLKSKLKFKLEADAIKAIVKTFKRTLAVTIAIGAIWASVMWLRVESKIQQLKSGDQLALIQQMKFEYGHYFNRLKEDEKLTVINSLSSTPNSGVYLNDKIDSHSEILMPMAAIIDKEHRQLHLIVFLSRKWEPNFIEIDQGSVNSRIVLATSQMDLGYQKDIDFNKHLFIDIADSEWKDQIRFLTFPIGKDFEMRAPKLFIKGYQRESLDTINEIASVELSTNL